MEEKKNIHIVGCNNKFDIMFHTKALAIDYAKAMEISAKTGANQGISHHLIFPVSLFLAFTFLLTKHQGHFY